ncbi:hypothetical protein B0H16DRAFT_1848701 [Mycena metata]|uniref:Uncharacterized protein n=1 Tax=Mycena metata TaxID=1033252 RepID=A0AAD7IRB2_9AGAR|nr:hypothetical protein B0H16DRAFT_1848701 [Mycena metata]
MSIPGTFSNTLGLSGALSRPLTHPEAERLAYLDCLKFFLATAPSRWDVENGGAGGGQANGGQGGERSSFVFFHFVVISFFLSRLFLCIFLSTLSTLRAFVLYSSLHSSSLFSVQEVLVLGGDGVSRQRMSGQMGRANGDRDQRTPHCAGRADVGLGLCRAVMLLHAMHPPRGPM